jgi:DNA repair protein RecO (recombination protein O)
MKNVETRGLVLFSRHYREQDKLVKIFTERFSG